MHKLYEYLCDELKTIERKVENGQDLSSNELEYANKLTEMKKNILKIEMLEGESDYSYARRGYGNMMHGGSHARGRRGGANQYGSYDYSESEDFMESLHDLMNKAPDDHKRHKIQRLINEMEHV